MSDFKKWWGEAEIFAGEGAMDAAEQAWDHQGERIDFLKDHCQNIKDFAWKAFTMRDEKQVEILQLNARLAILKEFVGEDLYDGIYTPVCKTAIMAALNGTEVNSDE